MASHSMRLQRRPGVPIHRLPSRRLELTSTRRGTTIRRARPLPANPEAVLRPVVLARDLTFGPEKVERLALEVSRRHRADRARVTIRWRRRIVPVPALQGAWCVECGEPWLCSWMRWAEHYLPPY